MDIDKRVARIRGILGECKPRAGWLNFHCPFHHGDGLNFGVRTDTGVYSCFGCGVTGTIAELEKHLDMRRTEGYLPDRAPPRGVKIAIPPSDSTTEELLNRLSNTTETSGQPVVDVEKLRNNFWASFRRVDDGCESITGTAVRAYVTRRGVDYKEVIVGTMEAHPNYAIFPFFDADGKLVYWQGRAVDARKPKTVNPDESKWFTGKNGVLWGYDKVRRGGYVVVGEGIFDAYSCSKALGVPGVALLGSTISKRQIQMLKDAGVASVLVFMDSDANVKAIKIGTAISDSGVKTYAVIWPKNYTDADPNSVDANTIRMFAARSIPVTPASGLRLLLEYV